MKENKTKQIKDWELVNVLHMEVYVYRCKQMSKLLLFMTVHIPNHTPLSVDIDLPEWKRRRRALGNLIGYEKKNDVTKFYYSIKKLRA